MHGFVLNKRLASFQKQKQNRAIPSTNQRSRAAPLHPKWGKSLGSNQGWHHVSLPGHWPASLPSKKAQQLKYIWKLSPARTSPRGGDRNSSQL